MLNERIIYKTCPLCDSTNIAMHKTADCSWHGMYNPQLEPTINWKKCSDCGHVFTEGYYTDEACSIIFSKTHDVQQVGNNLEHSRGVSAKMVEKVLPYVSDGIWADVGFGNGSLLFTAQEYGFTPIGVDLRSANVEQLKTFGIQAYKKNITELSLDEKATVISMADVLEHIPYPRETLHAVNKLLKHDGILLISMPNSENIVWESWDKENVNPYWGEIEHYHNFSRSRLYSLLSDFGFTARRYGISERYRACMEVVAQKTKDI